MWGCATDMPLAKAIERRFGELALRKRGISAAKNLVAGVRILERLELIPAAITDLHRLQLPATGKMAKAHTKGVGHDGRFPNPGGTHGTLGLGQGVLCGQHGIHPMPQGVGRR